jgi:hypothetical protein
VPHLKFTRDRRGYESTFLVHTARRRGKERPLVLYWFRTPPHVKVGRAAIDEDAIRALESQHPEIAFDWDRILEAKPPAPVEPEDGQGWRARRDRDRHSESRGERPPRTEPEPRIETLPVPEQAVADLEPPPGLTAADSAEREALDVPPESAWNGPDAEPQPARQAPSADSLSAAEQALGSLGLSKLRGRYAEVMARVHVAPLDQAARDKIAERAELLNPDSWVTAEDVTQGLDKFEQVLAEVVEQVGTPRRRTRRGGRRNRRRRDRMQAGQGGAPPSAAGSASTTSSAGPPDETAEARDDFEESDDDSPDGEPEPTI